MMPGSGPDPPRSAGGATVGSAPPTGVEHYRTPIPPSTRSAHASSTDGIVSPAPYAGSLPRLSQGTAISTVSSANRARGLDGAGGPVLSGMRLKVVRRSAILNSFSCPLAPGS
jgi:hypothetical protein